MDIEEIGKQTVEFLKLIKDQYKTVDEKLLVAMVFGITEIIDELERMDVITEEDRYDIYDSVIDFIKERRGD